MRLGDLMVKLADKTHAKRDAILDAIDEYQPTLRGVTFSDRFRKSDVSAIVRIIRQKAGKWDKEERQ
jgi:hypothetical protein